MHGKRNIFALEFLISELVNEKTMSLHGKRILLMEKFVNKKSKSVSIDFQWGISRPYNNHNRKFLWWKLPTVVTKITIMIDFLVIIEPWVIKLASKLFPLLEVLASKSSVTISSFERQLFVTISACLSVEVIHY